MLTWRYDLAKLLNRPAMIDALMEGVAFDDDNTIARVSARYRALSDKELKEEYDHLMNELEGE